MTDVEIAGTLSATFIGAVAFLPLVKEYVRVPFFWPATEREEKRGGPAS